MTMRHSGLRRAKLGPKLSLFAVTLLISWTHVQSVGSIALIANSGSPKITDIVNQPSNYLSWDKGTVVNPILYGFDPTFVAAFPDPLAQQQVHLAIQEWTKASLDVARRAAGAKYRWNRRNTAAPWFYDLRSLVIHEIGHVLGSQHPDAAWFNESSGIPFERNYVSDGIGGYMAAPPIGGEIMNEGQGPELPGSKPPKGMHPGEYWHHGSKDELAFLDYAYGRPIYFQYVADPTLADIVFKNYVSDTCNGNLASGGILSTEDRHPLDPIFGGIIKSGDVLVHEVCTDSYDIPIGFSPRPDYWSVKNQSGLDAIALSVTTEGTDNPSPTDQFTLGANRFTSYSNTVMPDVTESLDRIVHDWDQPIGGGVPSGASVQVMLQQDVWDWQVTDAELLLDNMTTCEVPLIDIAPFMAPVIATPPPPDTGDAIHGIALKDPTYFPLATLRIRNWGQTPLSVNEVLLVYPADTTSAAPLPAELPTVLAAATTAGDTLVAIDSTGGPRPPVVLGPGKEFHIVVRGSDADVALFLPEIADSGAYYSFPVDMPSTWFVVATKTDNPPCAEVQSITLMNPPVHKPPEGVNVEEPNPTSQFTLGPAIPNPATGSVKFRYTLPHNTDVSIRVYNVAGRHVRTLVSGIGAAGPHELVWDARDDDGRRVGPGVYFYKMTVGNWQSQRKVVFLNR